MSRTRWIAGIVVVLVVACSGGPARRASSGSPTVLEVQNDANLDMTIYVTAQSGNRDRLGLATAHRTSWFTIPQRLIFGLTPLRFQADPVGTGALPVSQEITVEPGDTVVLRIPPGS
jgi:hypothetical protein